MIMSEVDVEILREFQEESKSLIEQLTEILEKCEGDFSQVKSLEQYGQTVDRIMGAAKSIGLIITDKAHFIHTIGDYTALCKAVGYKASQIKDNEPFYNICVGLLADATEMLSDMIRAMTEGKKIEIKSLFSKTFLDRLKWVSEQFGADYRASVEVHKAGTKKMNQDDIDDLLKKLGLD
jgi:hypothetical protein